MTKKTDLTNKEWIKYQFDYNLDREIRDVLLHASFIEGICIIESEKYHVFPCPSEKGNYRSFAKAINLLSGKVDQNELDEIDNMRVLRNGLIHGIVKDNYDQNSIESKRNELYYSIVKNYGGNFIDSCFNDRFGISTKNQPKIITLRGLSSNQIKSLTSDT